VSLVPGAERFAGPISIGDVDRVLFACTRNSARSQMAAALWHRRTGIEAWSAGSQPAERVHPRAERLLTGRSLGSGVPPRGYRDVGGDFDLVVTVCDMANEAPVPIRARRLHWSIPDPVPIDTGEAFERAFDEIERRIELFASVVGR
jgi:protein-tyrosine-phosphatase